MMDSKLHSIPFSSCPLQACVFTVLQKGMSFFLFFLKRTSWQGSEYIITFIWFKMMYKVYLTLD